MKKNRIKSNESLHSLHPWYYISGRKDLTEKNISSKRERESQQHQKCVDNNQYYVKCENDSKLFDKWNQNKSLVKYHLKSTKPPFDIIEHKFDSKNIRLNKEIERKYIESNKKLSQMMNEFKKLDENYFKLEKSRNILISQLNEIQTIKKSIYEKQEFCELKEKRLLYIRFGREKLSKKVFLILDQLIYYKIGVQSIQDLNIKNELLSAEESNQISEVIDKALKIIEMYIQLNQNRNTEFQLMFDEEREQRWDIQSEEWNLEYQVWNSLVDKLIDSYQSILKEKLNDVLTQQQISLKDREKQLTELTTFTNELKRNPHLSDLLTQDITNLVKVDN